MLRRTFCHVPGIGRETERALWKAGCLDWQTLHDHAGEFRLGSSSADLAKATMAASIEALESGRHQYFRKALRQANAWRAWEAFRDRCVYLDIETDGGRLGQSVTVVGLYDGRDYTALVKGESLESFRDAISHYSLIVTFYGGGFDLPMLQRHFQGVAIDHIHVDLCPVLRTLGYRGGLKRIERELGIVRSDATDGLSGLDAIFLWRRYLRGDPGALDTLLAYNREDVVNLEPLAEFAFARMSEATITTPRRARRTLRTMEAEQSR